MTAASDIRRAKELLASKGLLSDISARDLAQSANELGKTLVETLEYIKRLLSEAGR